MSIAEETLLMVKNYIYQKKIIYTKNKVRPKITNGIVSPGESSVCCLLTSYLLIWLKMCSGNSWSWLKVLLRPSWIYLDGGDLGLAGFLSILCIFWDKDTCGTPLYIISFKCPRRDRIFFLNLNYKGRILVRPAVSNAYSIVKAGGEGCLWQLISQGSCKDLGACHGIVSQGDCAKPSWFYTVFSGSLTCYCSSLGGRPDPHWASPPKLLPWKQGLTLQWVTSKIHSKKRGPCFLLNDSTVSPCLRWQTWVVL